jgi:hypothetical protein
MGREHHRASWQRGNGEGGGRKKRYDDGNKADGKDDDERVTTMGSGERTTTMMMGALLALLRTLHCAPPPAQPRLAEPWTAHSPGMLFSLNSMLFKPVVGRYGSASLRSGGSRCWCFVRFGFIEDSLPRSVPAKIKTKIHDAIRDSRLSPPSSLIHYCCIVNCVRRRLMVSLG